MPSDNTTLQHRRHSFERNGVTDLTFDFSSMPTTQQYGHKGKLLEFEESFTLNNNINNINKHMHEALLAFNVQPGTIYKAMSGQNQMVLWGEEEHEDEEDIMMIERGPNALPVEEFFLFKIRSSIKRAMHTVGKLYVFDYCIDEYFEDPKYYREFIRNKSNQYIPQAKFDLKMGVKAVNFRIMTTQQLLKLLQGEVAPVHRNTDVVYLVHNSVRFYYKDRECKMGIIMNVERYFD
jgi:hypothetical protein